MAEDRASKRYKKESKTEPPAVKAEQADDDQANAGADGGENAAEDAYSAERKQTMNRHMMELRDIARQHRSEHRSVMSRHEKEMQEMMTRHMGGAQAEKMNEPMKKGGGDDE